MLLRAFFRDAEVQEWLHAYFGHEGIRLAMTLSPSYIAKSESMFALYLSQRFLRSLDHVSGGDPFWSLNWIHEAVAKADR